MWSDPIDSLIERLEDLISSEPTLVKPDWARMVKAAKEHRELEKRTGKVGFEATEARHG